MRDRPDLCLQLRWREVCGAACLAYRKAADLDGDVRLAFIARQQQWMQGGAHFVEPPLHTGVVDRDGPDGKARPAQMPLVKIACLAGECAPVRMSGRREVTPKVQCVLRPAAVSSG